MIVSQTFPILLTLIILYHTGSFCRKSLSLDLFDFFIIIRLGLCVLREEDCRGGVILII